MDIEEEFSVRFDNDAFEHCGTLGEVFDVVWAGLPASMTSGGKCPSQMAFYSLRRAVGDRKLRPDTPVNQIEAFRYADLKRALARQGWAMPGRRCAPATWWVSFATTLITVVVMWPYAGPDALVWAFGAFVLAMTVLHLKVFTSTGPDAATLAELVREMTALNCGKLLQRGASFSRHMLWDRFVRRLRESGIRGPVSRASRFY